MRASKKVLALVLAVLMVVTMTTVFGSLSVSAATPIQVTGPITIAAGDNNDYVVTATGILSGYWNTTGTITVDQGGILTWDVITAATKASDLTPGSILVGSDYTAFVQLDAATDATNVLSYQRNPSPGSNQASFTFNGDAIINSIDSAPLIAAQVNTVDGVSTVSNNSGWTITVATGNTLTISTGSVLQMLDDNNVIAKNEGAQATLDIASGATLDVTGTLVVGSGSTLTNNGTIKEEGDTLALGNITDENGNQLDYNVTYFANGGAGTDVVSPIFVAPNGPVAPSNTDVGFTYGPAAFLGWSEGKGPMPVDYAIGAAITSAIPAESFDLFAQWAPLTVTPAAQSVSLGAIATNLTATSTNPVNTSVYNWYSNDTNSNQGGTIIKDSTGTAVTSSVYTPPTATPGTTYYYCVDTANFEADGTTPITSNAVSVTVFTAGGNSFISNSAATPTSGSAITLPYDLSSAADVNVTVGLNGNALTQVLLNGSALASGSGFTFNTTTNVVTIPASVLAGLSTTTPSTVTFVFSAGANAVLTLNVGDTGTAALLAFDKSSHYWYIQGYPDYTFNPAGTMTRAEAALIFWRVTLDPNKNETIASVFTDVPDGAWFTQAINYLASKGVINGRTATTFDPNAPITRREFATIAARYVQLVPGTTPVFSDVPTTDPAFDFINTVYSQGWVEGYTDGTFQPDNNITRAEVVTIINRILGRPGPSADQIADYDNFFTDVTPDNSYFTQIIEAAVSHTFDSIADGVELGWTAAAE